MTKKQQQLKANQKYLAFNKHYEYSWRVYASLYESIAVFKTKEEAENWGIQNNQELLPAPRGYTFNPLAN